MKFLLFDFDGVFVDSFKIAYDSSVAVYPRSLSEEEYRNFFNGNIYDSVDRPEDTTPALSSEHPFFHNYTPRLLETNPVEGMVEVLRELHGNGSRKMVVVSSAINHPIERFLEKHDLHSLFGRVYGADVHKSKVIKMKMAMDEFGMTPDDSVFITDTLGDIREATKAGLRSIGVSWGFHRTETLQEGSPHAIAHHPKELLDLIALSPAPPLEK